MLSVIVITVDSCFVSFRFVLSLIRDYYKSVFVHTVKHFEKWCFRISDTFFLFFLQITLFRSQHDQRAQYIHMRMLHLNILFFHRICFLCRFQRMPQLKLFYLPIQYLNSQQHNALHSICFLFCVFWLFFDLDNCFDPIICLEYTYTQIRVLLFFLSFSNLF